MTPAHASATPNRFIVVLLRFIVRSFGRRRAAHAPHGCPTGRSRAAAVPGIGPRVLIAYTREISEWFSTEVESVALQGRPRVHPWASIAAESRGAQHLTRGAPRRTRRKRKPRPKARFS
jgi:hypothetical protein